MCGFLFNLKDNECVSVLIFHTVFLICTFAETAVARTLIYVLTQWLLTLLGLLRSVKDMDNVRLPERTY